MLNVVINYQKKKQKPYKSILSVLYIFDWYFLVAFILVIYIDAFYFRLSFLKQLDNLFIFHWWTFNTYKFVFKCLELKYN